MHTADAMDHKSMVTQICAYCTSGVHWPRTAAGLLFGWCLVAHTLVLMRLQQCLAVYVTCKPYNPWSTHWVVAHQLHQASCAAGALLHMDCVNIEVGACIACTVTVLPTPPGVLQGRSTSGQVDGMAGHHTESMPPEKPCRRRVRSIKA